MLVLSIGTGLPAYLAFELLEEREIMTRFWGTLVVFAAGWFVTRTFVRDHLDL